MAMITQKELIAPTVVSMIVAGGFITVVLSLMTMSVNFSEVSGQAFLVFCGILATSFTQVVHYWLGSSASSADKTQKLAALADKATP